MSLKAEREAVIRVLEEIENQIKRLKVSYEKYFGQIEKREPIKERQDLERRLRQFAQRRIIQTDLRVRFLNLSSTFFSYSQYWDRVVRRIEEGKFFPDQKKAVSTPSVVSSLPVSRGDGAQIEALYEEFVRVREACNLNTAPPDKNQVEAFFTQQKEKIARQLGTSDFDLRFSVVVEGGKPLVKFQVKKRS